MHYLVNLAQMVPGLRHLPHDDDGVPHVSPVLLAHFCVHCPRSKRAPLAFDQRLHKRYTRLALFDGATPPRLQSSCSTCISTNNAHSSTHHNVPVPSPQDLQHKFTRCQRVAMAGRVCDKRHDEAPGFESCCQTHLLLTANDPPQHTPCVHALAHQLTVSES